MSACFHSPPPTQLLRECASLSLPSAHNPHCDFTMFLSRTRLLFYSHSSLRRNIVTVILITHLVFTITCRWFRIPVMLTRISQVFPHELHCNPAYFKPNWHPNLTQLIVCEKQRASFAKTSISRKQNK